MAKYIIEIEDEPVNGLYIAKGFRTLVFDEAGLNRLVKVSERKGNTYYYITDKLNVMDKFDMETFEDNIRFDVGNYFLEREAAMRAKTMIQAYLKNEQPSKEEVK